MANAIWTMRRKKFNATKRRLFETAIRVLKKMDGVITFENLTTGLIKAELPGGLMSYGNDIRISIKSTPDNKNTVSVISRSTGIQIIDWGTNTENEEKIINRINSALS